MSYGEGFVELLLRVFSWNCLEDEDGRRRWKTKESVLVDKKTDQSLIEGGEKMEEKRWESEGSEKIKFEPMRGSEGMLL